ncbi:MAG: hypothetical protein NVV72_01205 [Asticcacaulis sp.]|nr:hypothetical protein [Asticcacaulis sp.]
MPQPYHPPHEDFPGHQGLKPRQPAMEGQPPQIFMDRRRGRLVTTGDDTPTLIALTACLVGLICLFVIGKALS